MTLVLQGIYVTNTLSTLEYQKIVDTYFNKLNYNGQILNQNGKKNQIMKISILSNYFEKGYLDAILNISMETQHSILLFSNYYSLNIVVYFDI